MMISILIPTIEGREAQLDELLTELYRQKSALDLPDAVQIHQEKDNRKITIGAKRNILLNRVQGKYSAFIDDDDSIPPNYLQLLLEAAKSGCDCASLKGIITFNGSSPAIFEHSIRYKEWKTTDNDIKYERFPNHLNLVRASIAKQFKFPEESHGEDYVWSRHLHESGLLKFEYYIPEIIYYYRYVSK